MGLRLVSVVCSTDRSCIHGVRDAVEFDACHLEEHALAHFEFFLDCKILTDFDFLGILESHL